MVSTTWKVSARETHTCSREINFVRKKKWRKIRKYVLKRFSLSKSVRRRGANKKNQKKKPFVRVSVRHYKIMHYFYRIFRTVLEVTVHLKPPFWVPTLRTGIGETFLSEFFYDEKWCFGGRRDSGNSGLHTWPAYYVALCKQRHLAAFQADAITKAKT
jgi:hypothetical protein